MLVIKELFMDRIMELVESKKEKKGKLTQEKALELWLKLIIIHKHYLFHCKLINQNSLL